MGAGGIWSARDSPGLKSGPIGYGVFLAGEGKWKAYCWMNHFDVLVIGGGAAGLFCAATAGKRGRRVAVLEQNVRPGNKVLISGGGRCNFTNVGASAANYVTHGSPHFPKSALARYSSADFLSLVERYGIAWHERKLGQLFCDHSSKEILRLLETECSDAGVTVKLQCKISGVRRVEAEPGGLPGWIVSTSQGDLTSNSLVIACGALSFPKLGASPFGYRVAEQFGIPLIPPRPGLVPLTFAPAELAAFGSLSGIALDCISSAAGEAANVTPKFRANLLFTHRGLSGPAVLQISSYLKPGERARFNLLPDGDLRQLFAENRVGGRELRPLLRQHFPERLVSLLDKEIPLGPIAQVPAAALDRVARLFHAWEFTPAGDEGYAKAEVTVGGVATEALSSKTMEARAVPGLYFIGEVVDITGWLGGYNFQWAWSSGFAAGQAV